jgi:diguanylate cyclase (GGDEF)-like protein
MIFILEEKRCRLVRNIKVVRILDIKANFKQFILRVGHLKTTVIVTVVACLSAISIFTPLMLWFNPETDPLLMAIVAFISALCIAPPIAWVYLDLIFSPQNNFQNSKNWFKYFVVKAGRKNSTLLMTFIAIIMANVISMPLTTLLYAEAADLVSNALITTFTTWLIAPPIAWVYLGVIFDLIQTQQQLEKLVKYDTLTNLFSRRYFFEQLAKYNNMHENSCMISIDIDHFKQINDTYGHHTGDKALQHFSNIISSLNSVTNYPIGRIGGEEFAVYIIAGDNMSAYRFAQEFQNELERYPLLLEMDASLKLTVSIGISCRSGRDLSLEQMIIESDKALYTAKNNGRNKIEFACNNSRYC